MPQASKIIVVESGSIKHEGTYEDIERADPELFAQWHKVKFAEENARKKLAPEECGAAKERVKLIRLLSKAVGFRGSLNDSVQRKRKKNFFLSRY